MITAAIFLAGCSGRHADAPGAITVDEASQLNDAAAMLDANSIDLDAVGGGNESETQ